MESLKNFFKTKRNILIITGIFLLGLIARIICIYLKQDIFLDEGSTTIISSYKDYWYLPAPAGAYSGFELKQLFLGLKPAFIDALKDITNLYKYNNDPSHTNLYYTLYRLWFIGKGNFQLKEFIIHGCMLNLFFFAGTFIYLYKILSKLFDKNNILISFGLFTTVMSLACISNTIFIRTYALQELFFTISTYYLIKYLDFIDEKNHIYKIKDLIVFSLVISFTLLTGFYAAILLFLYAGWLVIKALLRKNISAIYFIITAGILSLYLVFLFYPGIIYAFGSYRAMESYSAFADTENLKYLLLHSVLIVLKYIYCIPVIILFAYYLKNIVKKRLTPEYPKSDIIMPILVISAVWTLIILYICPYKTLRYIMPICPLLTLIFPYIANFNYKKRAFIIWIIAIMFLNYFIGISEVYVFKYRKYIFLPSKIDFLKNQHYDRFLFLQNPELPVYIISDGIVMPQNILPYLPDGQKYIVTTTTPQNIPYKHFYTIRVINISPFKPDELSQIKYKLVNEKYGCSNGFVCGEYIKN